MLKRYKRLSRARAWTMAISCKSRASPFIKNELASGERIVKVSEQGKPSETRFAIEERYQNATLVKPRL